MVRWMLAAIVVVLMGMPHAAPPAPAQQPPESGPTTQPADAGGTLRAPAQADILRQLLGRDERPAPIRPLDFGTTAAGNAVAAGVDAEGQPLLLEGC